MKAGSQKLMDKLEQVVAAWEQDAPEATFAGMKLDEFKAEVRKSQAPRERLIELEQEETAEEIKRNTADTANWKLVKMISKSVAGDPNHGSNSAVYKGMGYVIDSERQSGLTRKKKDGGEGENS